MAVLVDRLKAAGFSLSVEGEYLAIEPVSRLTAEQTAWIKAHKSELLAELKAANDAVEIWVEVWTPSGIPMRTRADSPEHAEWLKRMNPKPTHPRPVLPPSELERLARAEEEGATGELVIAPEPSTPARRALEILRRLFEQYAENHRQGGVTNGRVRVMLKHWREAIPGDARAAIAELEVCGLARIRDLFVEIAAQSGTEGTP